MNIKPSLEEFNKIYQNQGRTEALKYLQSIDRADISAEEIPSWIELEAVTLYENAEFLNALKCLRNGMKDYSDNLKLRLCFKAKKAYSKSLFMGWAKQGNVPVNFYEHLKSFIFFSEVFNPEDLLDIFRSGKQTSRDIGKEKEIFRWLATQTELYHDFYKANHLRIDRLLMPGLRKIA